MTPGAKNPYVGHSLSSAFIGQLNYPTIMHCVYNDYDRHIVQTTAFCISLKICSQKPWAWWDDDYMNQGITTEVEGQSAYIQQLLATCLYLCWQLV